MVLGEITGRRCYRCFRPIKTCYCKWIQPIDPQVKFVFLMHPKEAYRQRTGTGRLAHLSLLHSELIVGINFTDHPAVNAYINDPLYYSMVLYPGTNSLTSDSAQLQKRLSAHPAKKLLVFIIDATWILAKKMMRQSHNLQKLPMLSFSHSYYSRFVIKSQPGSFCLSTIESVYYLIKELQEGSLIKRKVDPEGLMDVFQKMINFQIECTRDPEKISYRIGKTKKRIHSKKRNFIFHL
ncbi:MAG: DTW domain-containing protein [Spirochaetes bacterium]|nr:DTW domain-containing protein [Spirochaetota bacterium]